MRARLKGFSLIEMAVVLMIIGLIGGMTLPALKIMLDWQKTTLTADRQEKILYAMANYVIQNKTLPYAADPADLRGKQDKENRRRRGIIPFYDLGLPESFAKDGHNHWFTYVVNDYYTYKYQTRSVNPMHVDIHYGERLPQICLESPPQSLSVKLPHRNITRNIALALISHGSEGRGAYPHASSNPPAGEDEKLNAASEVVVIERPLSKNPQNPFSHTVISASGPYLLAVYGHTMCPARKVLQVTGNLPTYKEDDAPPALMLPPGAPPAPPPAYQAPYDLPHLNPADNFLPPDEAIPPPLKDSLHSADAPPHGHSGFSQKNINTEAQAALNPGQAIEAAEKIKGTDLKPPYKAARSKKIVL